MGKFVVCAEHPSNEFFRSFPNCLTYKTTEEFVEKVREAISNDPKSLTSEQRYSLSWEAATQRFMEYSELDKVLMNDDNNDEEMSKAIRRSHGATRNMKKSVSLPNLSEAIDGGLAFAHFVLTGSEVFRLSTGAIPGSKNYDMQHSKDLNILPPQVQNPTYGW